MDLQNNKINIIPEDITKKMTNLKEIYLNNNNMTTFPLILFKMPNLKIIDLKKNHINTETIPKYVKDTFKNINGKWFRNN